MNYIDALIRKILLKISEKGKKSGQERSTGLVAHPIYLLKL